MMILNTAGLALATSCLWSLQEAAPEVEALLFTHVDGLTLTATLDGGERTQRLAAVSTALFLLSEHTAEAWGSGEAMEVQMRLTSAAGQVRHITIIPVGHSAILTALHSLTPRFGLIKADLELAAIYLKALLAGDTPPLPVNWQCR